MGLERHQSCGLRWLSDGEQGGVRGGAWAVKRAEEEERGGARQWCAPLIGATGGRMKEVWW
jgi:hypothetical protein